MASKKKVEEPTVEEQVEGSPEPPVEQPPTPIYVYAVAMMPNGDLKIVTELPFAAQRQAIPSDVIMTAGYIAEQVKSGAQF